MILILGAGPAGLTAALEALRHGEEVCVIEKSNAVGGISRTEEQEGWKFDLGGHRFFTKVKRVNDFWNSVLPAEDFLTRPRMSRIFYNGKYFDYPLKPLNALQSLGIIKALRSIFSLIITKLNPPKDQSHFEGWVAARFGWYLYSIFFKTYTEKVWGIPATSIQADWAAQRIKNLSLTKAILDAFGIRAKNKVITTLIDSFQYPRFGPGQMWNSCANKISNSGGQIIFETTASKIISNKNGYKVYLSNGDTVSANSIISSIPLSELPALLECDDQKVIGNSKNLKYRDFLTVALVVPENVGFPDNWIYIHSPEVKVGRIQNFASWSPDMVQEGFTCLGLEYFVNQGDDLWESRDSDLIELASNELAKLGIVSRALISKGYVVRVPKAYPVYDRGYQERIESIADWLQQNHPQIFPVGRNGMHRYNNQDHSMLTAMFAIDNIVKQENHNLWDVNLDDEYHEETISNNKGGRAAPEFQ